MEENRQYSAQEWNAVLEKRKNTASGSADENGGAVGNLTDSEMAAMKEMIGKAKEEIRMEKRSSYLMGILTGLVSAFLVVAVVFVITWIGKQPQDGEDTAKAATDQNVVSTALLQKMQTIERTINQYFYWEEDATVEKIQEGVYRGMVASLGDIYSEYYTAEEMEALMDSTQGIYYGIGAAVALDAETSYPILVTIYPGTPAEEAGLKNNDIIYEVEGESAYNVSTATVVEKIKGEEGTWVNLTIYRDGEYLSIDVQRRKVNIPTVTHEMLDDGMAYIQISEFDGVTVDQFAEALATVKGQGMKGLILDLRSNPGGNLDAVVEIARMILPEGLILYTEDKYGEGEEYTCDGSRQLEVPLVVLVNEASASASEVLSGAIKDHGIGTLVGMTTYGKGVVQSLLPMQDGSALKLTISGYYTPNGHDIHGIGIEPDVICEFDGEAYYREENPIDNQLEKAKEVLQGLMEK